MDKDVLLAHLTSPRRHVLGILDGLDDEQLQRAVLPSGWTPMQVVHHLAVDVERFWFRGTVAGEAEVIDAIEPESEGGLGRAARPHAVRRDRVVPQRDRARRRRHRCHRPRRGADVVARLLR